MTQTFISEKSRSSTLAPRHVSMSDKSYHKLKSLKLKQRLGIYKNGQKGAKAWRGIECTLERVSPYCLGMLEIA